MVMPTVSKFKQKRFEEAEHFSNFWNIFAGGMVGGVVAALIGLMALPANTFLYNVLSLTFGNFIFVYFTLVSIVLALALKQAVEKQQTMFIQVMACFAFGVTLYNAYVFVALLTKTVAAIFTDFPSVIASFSGVIMFSTMFFSITAILIITAAFYYAFSALQETFDKETIIVHFNEKILVRDYSEEYEDAVKETWLNQYEKFFNELGWPIEQKLERFDRYREQGHIRVILLQNHYVGFYLVNTQGALVYLAVKPGFERYGLGSIMIEDMLIMNNILWGATLLKAYVMENNFVGRQFLEENSWILDEQNRYFDRIIYFKTIASASDS